MQHNPSHDWAAKEPLLDFNINAAASINLFELVRKYSKHSPIAVMSTNKVYGDNPNKIALIEHHTRYEPSNSESYKYGIDESMSIDHCTHSLFGASKLAADIISQEYGKYFGMKIACFRGGCITGSSHSGAELHGFFKLYGEVHFVRKDI